MNGQDKSHAKSANYTRRTILIKSAIRVRGVNERNYQLKEGDMEDLKFLPTMIGQSLRETLLDLFQKAEEDAKNFFANTNGFVEIREVLETHDPQKAGWALPIVDPDGSKWTIIPICPNLKHLGTIIHEVFHSSFHESPSYKIESNKCWGDALCDAFRFFMEGKFIDITQSQFYGEISNCIKCNDGDITKCAQCSDGGKNQSTEWKIQYRYLPSRIIRKSNDYDGFKFIWKKLNSDQIIFNDFFFSH